MRNHEISSIRILLLLLSAAFAAPLAAEDFPPREDFRELLVPVRPGEISGQLGSRWITELWVYNDADVPVRVFQVGCVTWSAKGSSPTMSRCSYAPFPAAPIPPRSTVPLPLPQFVYPFDFFRPSSYLYVENAYASRVYLSLRTRDTSRETRSSGTEIPIVPIGEGAPRVELLNVPLSDEIRLALRVYTLSRFADTTSAATRLRVYDNISGALLADRELNVLDYSVRDPYIHAPPTLEVFAFLADLVDPGARRAVRVEVESNWVNVWAMISVTNNVTQEITPIWPQRGAHLP